MIIFKRLIPSTLYLCLLFLFSCSSGIKLKTLTELSKTEQEKEVISVRKKDNDVKEGPYEYYYLGNKLIEGEHKENKKTGTWTYFDSKGNISHTGQYLNGELHGKWVYYDTKNGNIRCSRFYDHAERDSTWKVFYPNGNLKESIDYKKGDRYGEGLFYYENGNIEHEVHYEDDKITGEYKTYFHSGQLYRVSVYEKGKITSIKKTLDRNGKELEGGSIEDGSGTVLNYYFNNKSDVPLILLNSKTYVDGKLSGEQKYFYEDGEVIASGKKEDGEYVAPWTIRSDSGEVLVVEVADSISSRFSEVTFPDDGKFIVFESMPEFTGDMQGLITFVMSHVEYPEKARSNNITGTVYAGFVIDAFGRITSLKILRSVHEDCDAEVLRVLKNMPPWVPGYQLNKPVKVQYNIPVRFSLK